MRTPRGMPRAHKSDVVLTAAYANVKKIPRSLGSGCNGYAGFVLSPHLVSYFQWRQLVRDKGPGGLIPLGFAPP